MHRKPIAVVHFRECSIQVEACTVDRTGGRSMCEVDVESGKGPRAVVRGNTCTVCTSAQLTHIYSMYAGMDTYRRYETKTLTLMNRVLETHTFQQHNLCTEIASEPLVHDGTDWTWTCFAIVLIILRGQPIITGASSSLPAINLSTEHVFHKDGNFVFQRRSLWVPPRTSCARSLNVRAFVPTIADACGESLSASLALISSTSVSGR
jgi:hypothetical protein